MVRASLRVPLRLTLVTTVAALLLLACGAGPTPRRGMILVLADSSAGHGPGYAALAEDALMLRGGLRAEGVELPTPTPVELRVELYTGRRDEGYLDEPNEHLPHLPWAVGRAGRRLIGVTSEAGLAEGHGFEAAFDDELERLPVAEVPAHAEAALAELDAWAAERGHPRGPIFLVVDLAGGSAEELDQLLTGLAPELPDSDVLIYFTGANSPDRLLISGPGLPKGVRDRAVDPRDLYPTVVELAQVPPPTILQGVDLLLE
ncbi:MAG: hypothetical protein P1V81_08010 [Planctomycetota bacterium]|nr:hypothetical protein [Planctomycetota bacterium]